ncbi:MAG: relaxase/mobilization nuclease domain-containing protein [Candidatus Binataceae bacterium]
MYTRNGKPRSNAWAAHARYLTREGAQLENEKGMGFDAEQDGIDMVAVVREWEKAGDERMWRIIVSPEDADRMDLKDHIRDLVGAMESDLGTGLEWVAIDHNNTDNPHAHLLLRGIDQSGKALLIDRDYVRNGIRARSQEIASHELGQRLEPEVLRTRGETITKERWTEIDRALKRRMNGDRVADYRGLVPHNDAARVRAEQEMQRLQFLEGLGLARKTGTLAWELSPNHERELRARQLAMDVIKRQAEANRVRSLNELADERDVMIANSATRGGYQGRFVGYFEDAEGRRYAGLQRGHAVTAIPTDRRDLRAGQEYVARPRGQEWEITEGRDRSRGLGRS